MIEIMLFHHLKMIIILQSRIGYLWSIYKMKILTNCFKSHADSLSSWIWISVWSLWSSRCNWFLIISLYEILQIIILKNLWRIRGKNFDILWYLRKICSIKSCQNGFYPASKVLYFSWWHFIYFEVLKSFVIRSKFFLRKKFICCKCFVATDRFRFIP